MPGLITAIILALLTPVVVASSPSTDDQKAARFGPDESNRALLEYKKALAEGRLTKPGRIIERAGSPQR